MARITAERLERHLATSGFVLMKQPRRTAPTTSHMPPPSEMPDQAMDGATASALLTDSCRDHPLAGLVVVRDQRVPEEFSHAS